MLNNIMKIHELLSEAIDLPNDGQGNYVVWDPQRRTEVIVPEKVVVKMMADRRIVGGSLNTGKPSDYPINRSVIYKPSKAVDPNAPKVAPKSTRPGFIDSFKQGFKGVQQAADNIAYSPVGRALGKVNQWAKADVRKSTMR
jgi:hypothetical protein